MMRGEVTSLIVDQATFILSDLDLVWFSKYTCLAPLPDLFGRPRLVDWEGINGLASPSSEPVAPSLRKPRRGAYHASHCSCVPLSGGGGTILSQRIFFCISFDKVRMRS